MAAPQTNGYALVLSLRRLDLPAVSSAATFATAWRCLKQRFKQLPDELRVFSPPQHAMLAYLCNEWAGEPSRLSAEEFMMRTFQGKLYPEVRWLGSHSIGCNNKTWLRLCGAALVDESRTGVYGCVCARVLTGCPRCAQPTQVLEDMRVLLQSAGGPMPVKTLRQLLDPMVGMDANAFTPPLREFLGAYTEQRGQRMYVDSPLYSMLLGVRGGRLLLLTVVLHTRGMDSSCLWRSRESGGCM